MDTKRIQKICDEYLENYKSESYHEDNDWHYWIFEATLGAVFGNEVWEKLRKIDKEKTIRRRKKEIEKLQAELESEESNE